MSIGKATAVSCANIAFIKYWGNSNPQLRLPANGSISMNLDRLVTHTTVHFTPDLRSDTLNLNGRTLIGAQLSRVSDLLERVRRMASIDLSAEVVSENNFPTGSGIASSASAFSALALAAAAAAGLTLSEQELSMLARTGSGSACRSVPGGFVEWKPGTTHLSSYAFSIAPPDHWELVDCVAIVSREHKVTGSTSGHSLADTSPLQAARVEDTPRRIEICRRALLARDFEAFAAIVEADSNLMHAVMQTSTPALLYWLPATMAVMHAVQRWRALGTPVCYTIDAGPNIHVICEAGSAERVEADLRKIPGVIDVLTAQPGGPARLVRSPA